MLNAYNLLFVVVFRENSHVGDFQRIFLVVIQVHRNYFFILSEDESRESPRRNHTPVLNVVSRFSRVTIPFAMHERSHHCAASRRCIALRAPCDFYEEKPFFRAR